METSQLLSLASPVTTQRAHEQSGRRGRDGYARAQQHGLVLRLTWPQPLWGARSAAAETVSSYMA